MKKKVNQTGLKALNIFNKWNEIKSITTEGEVINVEIAEDNEVKPIKLSPKKIKVELEDHFYFPNKQKIKYFKNINKIKEQLTEDTIKYYIHKTNKTMYKSLDKYNSNEEIKTIEPTEEGIKLVLNEGYLFLDKESTKIYGSTTELIGEYNKNFVKKDTDRPNKTIYKMLDRYNSNEEIKTIEPTEEGIKLVLNEGYLFSDNQSTELYKNPTKLISEYYIDRVKKDTPKTNKTIYEKFDRYNSYEEIKTIEPTEEGIKLVLNEGYLFSDNQSTKLYENQIQLTSEYKQNRVKKITNKTNKTIYKMLDRYNSYEEIKTIEPTEDGIKIELNKGYLFLDDKTIKHVENARDLINKYNKFSIKRKTMNTNKTLYKRLDMYNNCEEIKTIEPTEDGIKIELNKGYLFYDDKIIKHFNNGEDLIKKYNKYSIKRKTMNINKTLYEALDKYNHYEGIKTIEPTEHEIKIELNKGYSFLNDKKTKCFRTSGEVLKKLTISNTKKVVSIHTNSSINQEEYLRNLKRKRNSNRL